MPETSSYRVNARLFRLLAEVASLALLVISLAFFLALFSYNSQDPSWSNPVAGVTTNLLGTKGAWLADLLFALFGLAAWVLPFACVYLAWVVFARPWLAKDWPPLTPSIRLVGWLLVLCSLSLGFHLAGVKSELIFGAGGALGAELSRLLIGSLGNLGASLAVISSVLAGVGLGTGLSWLTISDELGYTLTTRLPAMFIWLGMQFYQHLKSFVLPVEPVTNKQAVNEPELGNLPLDNLAEQDFINLNNLDKLADLERGK